MVAPPPYDPQNIFAKILRGELPCHRLYEDDECVAILDICPVNPGHLLVIPKVPAVTVPELDPVLVGHLMEVGARLSKVVRVAAPKCEAVNFWISDGTVAGQEVPHVHLHVIPRFSGDGFGFKVGPQNRKAAAPEDLNNLADHYRTLLETL